MLYSAQLTDNPKILVLMMILNNQVTLNITIKKH